MNLKNKKCIPCEGGIPSLNIKESGKYLKIINSAWKISENKRIERRFKFVNFAHTMAFVNKVAKIAEQEGHHPDMYISYSECKIELWTHAINGLSENDFILAAKIDELA
ncbi:putative pterin-4-alpha-carbinolamine dehydratase [subsurface metagenome]